MPSRGPRHVRVSRRTARAFTAHELLAVVAVTLLITAAFASTASQLRFRSMDEVSRANLAANYRLHADWATDNSGEVFNPYPTELDPDTFVQPPF